MKKVKIIRAIIFGVLALITSASMMVLMALMCVVEIYDFVAYLKWLLVSAVTFGITAPIVMRLWEKWYKQD